MTENDGEDTRSIAEDGTQTDAQSSPAAGRSAGPAPSVGGRQEPGGPVPPYEGRRDSADVDEGGTHRDGVRVGGATGPRTSEEPPDDPAATPGGRTTSPAEGAAAPVDTTTENADYEADPGVGPAHQSRVRKGEDEPE